MGQTWEALMFCHWRVDQEAIQRVMPPQLEPDRYDGDVWLGVTPFVVRALRLRGIPPLPVLSSFPEINVRTYVTVGGKPGIYFFSLDAASRPAVAAARRAYRLPYFRSAITATQLGDTVSYRARRLSDDGPAAAFEATYGPVGPRFTASPGTLEHFLTERYCLYTLDEKQTIYRGDIHHPPWPLQPAEAEIETNTMASGLGLALDGEPVLHFAARQDVALWRIQALD